MSEIIEWVISAGILFLMAVILFFYGIKARSRSFFYASLLTGFLGVCVAGWAGWIFVKKSYQKLETLEIPHLEQRTAQQIYDDIFGHDTSSCVEMINRQDQIVPRIDTHILLEFSACPKEIDRIIKQAALIKSSKKISRSDLPSASSMPDWFQPEYLGPDRLSFTTRDREILRQRILVISPDSSRAFYADIAD